MQINTSTKTQQVEYQLTAMWYREHVRSWAAIVNHFKPKTYLEVGSFEGGSLTWFTEALANYNDKFTIYCVDTWEGGEDHDKGIMQAVESRFDFNLEVLRRRYAADIYKIKAQSYLALSQLLVNQNFVEHFDLIFIDGSHQSPDVILDCCLAYKLLKRGGVLILDDYIWRHELGILHEPKLAIDSFVNIYRDKLAFIPDLPLRQVSLVKVY